jgi:hypothetical protein
LVFPFIIGTSFFSTIIDILWFRGRAYHSMIQRLFYHFVLEILWHPCSLAWSCIKLSTKFHKFC